MSPSAVGKKIPYSVPTMWNSFFDNSKHAKRLEVDRKSNGFTVYEEQRTYGLPQSASDLLVVTGLWSYISPF